ncbi:MAG TPA: LexA family transcriptional regulator [Thermoanaerobaculia bacterium]|jgi:SOS-response transcriptional repressor LexA
MMTLAEGVDAAIKASGKTAAEVAREAGTSPENISRIRSGENANPTYQLLLKIAHATHTTLGALNGESIRLSDEDETTLVGFRDWIDGKLATKDALTEPNATVIRSLALKEREMRIADQKHENTQPPANPFGTDANLVLRAIGDSMNGAGILAGDWLYASTRPRDAMSTALGKIVACRIGDDVFVKRLTSKRRRHFLLSAHARYRPIEIDPEDPKFTILGVVVGRVGRVQ